jgi:hypothetical protein
MEKISDKSQIIVNSIQSEKYKFSYLLIRLICKTVCIIVGMFRIDFPQLTNVISGLL